MKETFNKLGIEIGKLKNTINLPKEERFARVIMSSGSSVIGP